MSLAAFAGCTDKADRVPIVSRPAQRAAVTGVPITAAFSFPAGQATGADGPTLTRERTTSTTWATASSIGMPFCCEPSR